MRANRSHNSVNLIPASAAALGTSECVVKPGMVLISSTKGSCECLSTMTSTRLKYALDTPSAPSVYARPIRRALLGPWVWQVEARPRPPTPAPDLNPFGDLGLLTSRTRRQLIRVREHALAARAVDRDAA